MADNSSTSDLQCIVVTPEATILDVAAEFVAVPLFDGEIGIGKLHSAMIGRLGHGELRIKTAAGTEAKTTRLYVDGGFVQVAEGVVSVMTNRAMAPEKIDTAEAQKELEKALATKASGTDAMSLRQSEIGRARGMLRVAAKS